MYNTHLAKIPIRSGPPWRSVVSSFPDVVIWSIDFLANSLASWCAWCVFIIRELRIGMIYIRGLCLFVARSGLLFRLSAVD